VLKARALITACSSPEAVMVPPSTPLDLPALVALMYRADWTTLSLSATLTVRAMPEPERPGRETSYRLLLHPGGKYRISPAADPGRVLEVCDAETAWVIVPGQPWEAGADAEEQPPVPPRRAVRRAAAGPGSPFEELLIPATLLSRYTLEPAGAAVGGSTRTSDAGTESIGGRVAYRLMARPRLIADRRPEKHPDQVVVHVDAELGILLRREESFGGEPLKVIELSGVRSDLPEVVDPGQFQPPSGLPVEEARIPFGGPGVSLPGLGGDAVRAAAGVTATAIGFAVRHWPSPGRPAGDAAARQMPGRGGPRTEGLEPAGDDPINLLHRTGRAAQAFTAEVHEWVDGDFVTRAVARGREFLPPAVDGILGPDAVWDAMASRAETTYKVMRLRLAPPGRYRIDRLAGRSPADPETTACDGEHQWLVRGTKVTFWDAMPLPRELARLADPAWLLAGFTLRAGGETEVGGRRGQLVVAERRTDRADAGWRVAAGTAADRAWAGRHAIADPGDLGAGWLDDPVSQVQAVVDQDLAVVLRVESFAGGRPVMCYEMCELVPGLPDPRGFEVPQGARRSGPLEGVGLLSPANAVKGAAGLGVAGAAALAGWLQKRPRS
jgi:hypothetical protein